MVFVNPLIEVALIAAAWFALFQLLRYKFVDQKAQEKAKEKQKEWKELLKKNDTKKAEEVQKEVMELNFKVMRGTMPMMGVSLLMLFTVFPVLNSYYAEGFPVSIQVPIPFLDMTPSWIWCLVIVNITLSIGMAVAKKVWKKLKEKKKEQGE